ncbi:hypothetical protein Q4P96_07385, partial [Neisseria gonorrhoeae]|nr:hypothetical protein [Neisseria gonorrhoeae]MDO6050096.1 hypothetical protein [Neisseria gonorrhoeae]MDO6056485.1 hypothetical protein [Neisseria gonorrhoeae]MDO6083796.1 hypothetical protein [Neisseria gonorrhoeae]MDO6087801.1 hypothetical protein [Neisseria gonorrhoeae]
STGSLQPNRRFRVGGRIGGSVGIPPDFLHIGRTRQIFAVLFARRGRYTKLSGAPIMGGNENAVPIRTTTDAAPCGQASHSERFRRHFYWKAFFCNRLTQSGFLCKNCHNSRLSSSGAANAFKIPTKGTFSYHVRLSRL